METGYKVGFKDGREALRQVIENGRGYEKTASHLWPKKPLRTAYARLKACTSPTGDEKLDFDEIVTVCEFNERADALMYMCDRLCHERPKPRSPEERRDDLMQRFNHQAEQLMDVIREIRLIQPGAKGGPR